MKTNRNKSLRRLARDAKKLAAAIRGRKIDTVALAKVPA